MDLTIYKHPLTTDRAQVVKVDGRVQRVLSAQMQGDVLQLWVMLDSDAPVREDVRVLLVGTGHAVPPEHGEYISTVQLFGGSLVFHVFAWVWATHEVVR